MDTNRLRLPETNDSTARIGYAGIAKEMGVPPGFVYGVGTGEQGDAIQDRRDARDGSVP